MIIPDTQHQDHLLERLAHGSHATQGAKVVVVPKRRLLLDTKLVADVVDRIHTLNNYLRIRDDFAVLDIKSVDALQRARVRAIISDELSNDCEGFRGVDRLLRAVEFLIAQPERVEVAAI